MVKQLKLGIEYIDISAIGITLAEIGDAIIRHGQKTLNSTKKRWKNNLFNSFDYKIEQDNNATWDLIIEMNEYGKFIDRGVNGIYNKVMSMDDNYNYTSKSQFSYRRTPRVDSNGQFLRNLEEWAVDHGMPKSAAYGIRTNIINYGIEPTFFFTKAMMSVQNEYNNVVRDFSNAVDETIEYILDEELAK